MVIVWRGCFLFHLSFWDRGVHLIIYGIRGFFETTLLVLCSRRWVDTARGTRYAEIVLKQSISRLTQCYCASRRLSSKQNEHSFVWFSLKNKNQFIFEGRRRNCQVKKFKLYWLPCLKNNQEYCIYFYHAIVAPLLIAVSSVCGYLFPTLQLHGWAEQQG